MSAPVAPTPHSTGVLTVSKGDRKTGGLFVASLLLILGILGLTVTFRPPVFVGDTVKNWMLVLGSPVCFWLFLSPRFKGYEAGMEPVLVFSSATFARGVFAYFSSDRNLNASWPWVACSITVVSLVVVIISIVRFVRLKGANECPCNAEV